MPLKENDSQPGNPLPQSRSRSGREKKNIIELTRWTPGEYASVAKLPVMLVLDNVRSLHNVGSLFRTADALGLCGIKLCGITGCPPHPELAKTALGAEDTVEWTYEADTLEACRRLADGGWEILVLEQTHDSMPLQDFHRNPDRKYALVVGNEVSGVSQAAVDMASAVLEIPQRGMKHSLNVSVSAGMALWQICAPATTEGCR